MGQIFLATSLLDFSLDYTASFGPVCIYWHGIAWQEGGGRVKRRRLGIADTLTSSTKTDQGALIKEKEAAQSAHVCYNIIELTRTRCCIDIYVFIACAI